MMLRKVLVWVMGALIVSAVAFAAGNATLMGNYYQNATNGAVVDSLGNALTSQAGGVQVVQTIINDTTSVGCADSTTTPFYTANMRRGFLFISFSNDSLKNIRFAVRVQGVTSATTLSNSTVYNFQIANEFTSNPSAAIDSVGKFSTFNNSPTAVTPASSEYIVEIANDLSLTGVKFGRSRAIVVPLVDSRGNWLWAPYMHVVVRTTGVVKIGTTSAAKANTSTVVVQYRGTTL